MRCYLTWEQMERGMCAMLAIFPALLSLAVFVGGADRMPSPNYDELLQFSHGNTWPYGVSWAVCAVMLVLESEKIRIGGLALVVLVSDLWAGLFLKAALDVPNAAFTPTAAYAGYGFMAAAVLGLVVIHRRRRIKDGVI